MDVTLAKTFLAIVEAGNFREASERMYVTQSTVSARIKSLEEQLGKTLFVRNKSGATLTQAGNNFLEYAVSFIQIWEKALIKVSSEPAYQDYICVGARPGLWGPIIMKWLPWAKLEFPHIALKADFGTADDLTRKLEEGIIDIAILLSAPTMPGIKVEQLYMEHFYLVTDPDSARALESDSDISYREIMEKNYIDVDWGGEFKISRKHYFPGSFVPSLSVSVGIYGVSYIVENGGFGYFPNSMIREYVNSYDLVIVGDAPVIQQPVYLACCKDNQGEHLQALLDGFRTVVSGL